MKAEMWGGPFDGLVIETAYSRVYFCIPQPLSSALYDTIKLPEAGQPERYVYERVLGTNLYQYKGIK